MSTETKTMTFEEAANTGKAELLINGAAGIYVPKEFAQSYVVVESSLDEDMEICLDPDHSDYWEAWANITDNGTIMGKDGHTWTLYQDSDLWAIRDDANIDWDSVG